MADLEKIKSISAQDADIGLNYGHYKPLSNLINERGFKEVIEIGCAYGNLAEHILDNTKIDKMYSIDPYKAYPQMPGLSTQQDYDLLFKYVIEKIDKHNDRWFIVRNTSEQFINGIVAVDDIEVDLVFIDGLHEYDMVKWEIENYSTLIRPNGILSGHDITVFSGIDQAVYEYQEKTGKELFILPGNVWYFEM